MQKPSRMFEDVRSSSREVEVVAPHADRGGVLLQKAENAAGRDGNLIRLLEAADAAANRSYLMACSSQSVIPFADRKLASGLTKSLEQLSVFRVTRLVYGANENPIEKLKSFFLSFSGLANDPSLFFILQNECTFRGKRPDGSEDEYRFSMYVGVKPQGFAHSEDDADFVRKVFKESFDGTFLGSSISEALTHEEIRDIQRKAGEAPDVVCVTAQPSAKKDSDEKTVEQGLEQLIDVMRNQPYTAVLLATPVDKVTIERRKRDLENLYSKLSLFQKVSVAYGENESKAIGESLNRSTSLSESNGESLTETNSKSVGTTEGGGTSSSTSYDGSSSGSSTSWSRSETISFSTARGTSRTTTSGTSEGRGESRTDTRGSSVTHTVEAQNKSIVDLLARLDETLKRMASAETFGLWECAGYFMAPTFSKAAFAANSFKSLILGDESAGERCHTIHWPRPTTGVGRERQRELCHYILSGEHPVLSNPSDVFRRILPTNFVSGKDLPYFLRLPQKSVPGLAVDTIASFERSVVIKGTKRPTGTAVGIEFGHVCHMDKEELPISLDLNDFTQHCFITGSTGSGKSNTTELLLQRCIEKDVDFLVIEPAKGEYKKSFKNAKGIRIFTTHPLCEELLHVNPFKFPREIHVLEHIDRLLGIFSSCWELTAAMPAILKKSVEQAYQRVGWDLANSYFIGESKSPVYPTFSDLTRVLREVIESSSYSAESKGNYTGALVTRVESLTAGVLRQIFCSEFDVEPRVLFDGRTVVDLSRLGSTETKTLLMGVLVMQLSEHRQATTKGTNRNIRHVTVIEEAHNLLRNGAAAPGGSSDIVGKSVEMISNAIAEMRTYGEGFMIVDQSPTSVDISAIKNTNTKIVMRLPEQHDCEAVASAMGLDEFQTKELAKLPPGVAVVMQNSWASAVLAKVLKSSPPKGEEEWTDPSFNRAMRARLALELAYVGYMRGQFYAKENANLTEKDLACLKRRSDIDDMLGQLVRSNYRELVGEARYAELALQGDSDFGRMPLPVRLKELQDVIRYYSDEYAIWTATTKMTNYKGFGKLVIALLGCEECWRIFLSRPVTSQNDEEFRRILRQYVPVEIREGAEEKLVALEKCVCKVLVTGGIVAAGGSPAEQKSFGDGIRKKPIKINV